MGEEIGTSGFELARAWPALKGRHKKKKGPSGPSAARKFCKRK